MIGRVASLLPIVADIGLRVNLVSVFVSAFTSLFLFLTIVRLFRAFRGVEQTSSEKWTVYGAAAIGAMVFSFSHSFWFNAVEAEVYAASMGLTAFAIWLGLKWLDLYDRPVGNALLLFVFYLTGLACGIHLLNVLILLPIAYIIAFKHYPVTFKNFMWTGVIGSAIVLAIYPGIIQGFPMVLSAAGLWGVVPILAGLIWWAYYSLKNDNRKMALALMAILLTILGYSTFLVIKIRSGMNPFLDENDPETWKALLSYLNREQYGTESLFLTMFQRKADFWSYQIRDMYLRYLAWQFVPPMANGLTFAQAPVKWIIGILPFLVGFLGIPYHFSKDKKGAIFNLMVFIVTGLAIVMYLNQDNPQPRDRDYAYVGSYFAFAVWVAFGALWLIEGAINLLKKVNQKQVAAVAVLGLAALLPVDMLIQNYHSHDRSGNWVAWDYSYNLLNSCDQDGILYTNGDNDTFPLWYLQVVAGVRQDVRVVNLSLLNTGWFIKQIRDKEPRVPMPPKITDTYVDNVIESRDISGLIDRRWAASRRVQVEGETPTSPKLVWDVPGPLSYPVGPNGENEYFLRVQDLMILNTIAVNAQQGWKRPIFFAVTVSDNNLCGLRNMRDPSKNFLVMEGLVFRVMPRACPLIDPLKTADLMMHTYKYRGIADPKVFFDDNVERLLGNYRQGLIQIAYDYLNQAQQSGDNDTTSINDPLKDRVANYEKLPIRVKALTALEFMDSAIPEDRIPIRYDQLSMQIARLYAQLGRPEHLLKKMDKTATKDPLSSQSAYEYGAYYLSDVNAPDQAKAMFDKSIALDPSFENLKRVAYTWMQFGGDANYASGLLKQAISRDPSRAAQLKVAGQAVGMGLGDWAVREVYQPMLSADPNDAQAMGGLIEGYARTGNTPLALSNAQSWLRSHPADSAIARRARDLASAGGR